jgi:cell shape-determining protein MreC
MKVQSQRTSSRKRLVRIILIAVVVIGAGLLAPKAFSVVSQVVMAPFHATNNWLRESSSLVPTFIRERQSLNAEIEKLENELQVAQRTTITRQRLFEENVRLRGLLGAAQENRIAAGVIARPDTLPYDYIQIDQGLSRGIQVGAPVFAGPDIVVGLVMYAAQEYSFVSLFTSPGFNATVFVSGPDVVATMEGMGGGVARVRMPQGIAMNVGNLVYVPSIEPGVFGRISYLENEPTQPEQYGFISPDIAISSLHTVAVGKVSQISRSVEEIDAKISEELFKTLIVPGVGLNLSSSTASTTASTTVSITSESQTEI